MTHEAVFTAGYDTAERARLIQRSVELEAGDIEGDRTRARIERDDDTLTVTLTARDLIALRAGLNTWLSLLAVAERCSGDTPTTPE